MRKIIDENDYYWIKVCEFLLVDSNSEKTVLRNEVLSSVGFLNRFLQIVEMFANQNALDKEMKENILSYIYFVRCNGDMKGNGNEIISKIISLVNNKLEDASIGFYRNELYKRNDNILYLDSKSVPKPFILKKKGELFRSIRFDQFLLYTHSIKVSDEEFVTKYLSKLVDDDRYYESLNCILNEYPQQFLNKLFYKRYSIVMSNNLHYEEDKRKKQKIRDFADKVDRKKSKLK